LYAEICKVYNLALYEFHISNYVRMLCAVPMLSFSCHHTEPQ